MKFYIVTPTYNALSWLPRCIRSVADQVTDGVEVHHHVQDGGSSDGTPAWLQEWQASHADLPGYTFTYESGKDAGMYDALNIAWSKIPSDADITAHLNSDEQYLPNALKTVADGFLAHAEAEVILTSYIVVDANGNYVCHRRSVRPLKWVSNVACEIYTCTCFHRVDAFNRHGIRFDTRFRSIADMVMYRAMVNAGVRFCALPSLITSVFAMTGGNLAWSSTTENDWSLLLSELPALGSWFNQNVPYRYAGFRRRFADYFCATPESYNLYMTDAVKRVRCTIEHPTTHWLSELPPSESE